MVLESESGFDGLIAGIIALNSLVSMKAELKRIIYCIKRGKETVKHTHCGMIPERELLDNS